MSNIVQSLYAYGHYLYLQDFLTNPIHEWKICERILDLNTGEWTILSPPENQTTITNMIAPDTLLSFYTPTEAMVVTTEPLDVTYETHLYRRSLSGDNAELLGNYPCNVSAADNEYIYMSDPWKGRPAQDSLHIYDHNLVKIDEIPFEGLFDSESKYGSCVLFPMPGDILMLRTQEGSDYSFYYFRRSEIGSGKIELHQFFQYNMEEFKSV